MVKLEVCVDTLAGIQAAKVGGADRVELCAALSEGGLTPSIGVMKAASTCGIPCSVMIRPRAGLFHFDDSELQAMLEDIRATASMGLTGVVLGAQTADGRLDLDTLARLKGAATGLETTLHRVMDVVPDPFEALEQAVALGFDRVLTSGGASSATTGSDVIAQLVERAAGRISVMAGAGVTPDNVGKLLAETGVGEVHASCRTPADGTETPSPFDPAFGLRQTDVNCVRRMTEVLA